MTKSVEVLVPNLGGGGASNVIELLVKKGQTIAVDDPLLTLESDKASMELPSPYAGKIAKICVSEGDSVSEGDTIFMMEGVETISVEKTDAVSVEHENVVVPQKPKGASVPQDKVYAGPFVRRMAFELGIELSSVQATGSGGRVTIEDMKKHLVRDNVIEAVDFSQWGAVRSVPMTKVQRLSATHLTRICQQVPQVTQHHQADVTQLDSLRKSTDVKLTMITFVMKAIAQLMNQHEPFKRAWVDDQTFCVRDYCHIGFAVETPNGLVVPVCHDVDKKDIQTLAKDIVMLSEKAREGKLTKGDLEGSCATISSLGGIGGGHFTPIVNAPDAFILGISRASFVPVYDGEELVRRYMMPMSLTYDHRLIDGADGARFVVGLAALLEDMPNLMGNDILSYAG